jgi:hypothetical protein
MLVAERVHDLRARARPADDGQRVGQRRAEAQPVAVGLPNSAPSALRIAQWRKESFGKVGYRVEAGGIGGRIEPSELDCACASDLGRARFRAERRREQDAQFGVADRAA